MTQAITPLPAQGTPAPAVRAAHRHDRLFALIHARSAANAPRPGPKKACSASQPRRLLSAAERAALGYVPSFGR